MGLDKPITRPQRFRTTRHLLVFFVFWSVVVAALAVFNSYRLHQMSREIGIRAARASFNKDQAIRYWATIHGGVYVPVNAATPPNPFLDHIPDRDIITPTGKKFTLMNPAYMSRQMNENFAEEYGIEGHITSLKPLRPENRADAWETKALQSFEQGNQESLELTEINGKSFLRLMQPMIVKEGCLKCHAQQGYKIGDIRGGVAISWPMEDLLQSGRYAFLNQSASLLLLWLLGSYFIYYEGKGLRKADRQRNYALAEMKEIKERLEFVVAGARVGTWDWDVQTGVLLLNERWAEMLGYTLAEIKPHVSTWEKLIHPDDLEKTMRNVTELLEDRIPSYVTEHRLRHKSGKWIWILAIGKVLERDHGGKPLRAVGINIDISNRKEQEQKRLEMSLQEEQFKHFESLKTMAGAIAHRFNNAMMAVQGNLELMIETLSDDSDEYKMASDAALAARGASLVGSMMLSYVGQRPLQLREISLFDLVRECSTTINALSHPSISLKIIPPAQALYCSIDQQQIKEVLENILTNAVESLENSTGTIEISFGEEYYTTDSFPIAFQAEDTRDGMYAFCQIKDTGQGIRPENLPRIFEPFYTTRFVGRGLGLALTVGVMRKHRGGVTITSTLAKGTTVRLLLPAISSSQQTVPSSQGVQNKNVHLSGDILLVDDDEILLTLGRMTLEQLGFTVHTALNGKEAVDKVRKQDIDFCAAVMDISMPVMDGIEAMKIMRTIDPAMPILLITGYSENDFQLPTEQGARPDCFMRKPFHLTDLRESLEKLLS